MTRRLRYGAGIAAVGVVLSVVQLVQGFQQLEGFTGSTRLLVFAFETVPFVLIGLSLVFVGYWLTRQETYEEDLERIVAWGVGSVLLFASVAALLLFSQEVTLRGETLAQAPYVAVDQITVGAVVGVLVGLYDAQSRARKRELEHERDRVEQFAQKAADINNYGRELNRSSTVDEVSALCIQAVQAFLGVTEMAFVVTDDEESRLVDNTVGNCPETTLVSLARDARDQEQATVVRHESPPEELPDGVEVISILVSEHDDTSAVLLALTDESRAFKREDVQLLEMLVAHAATALEGISRQRYDAIDQ